MNIFVFGATLICFHLKGINTVWNVLNDECKELEVRCSPTIFPIQYYNAEDDAQLIHNGFSKRKIGPLLNIISRRTFSDKSILLNVYNSKFNSNLVFSMMSMLPRTKTRDLLSTLLVRSLGLYFTKQLKIIFNEEASSTKFLKLMDIFGSISKNGLEDILTEYNYGPLNFVTSLAKQEFTEETKQFLYDLVYEKVETGDINLGDLREDINKLQTSAGPNGVNCNPFVNLALNRGNAHLRRVYEGFEFKTRQSYAKVLLANIEKYEAEEKYRLLYSYYCITKDRAEYFAERLHESLGKKSKHLRDDAAVQRLIIGRSEIDLENIKNKYKAMYGQNLSKHVKKRFKGTRKVILLKILESPFMTQ